MTRQHLYSEIITELKSLRRDSEYAASDWIREDLDSLIDKWQERLSYAEKSN